MEQTYHDLMEQAEIWITVLKGSLGEEEKKPEKELKEQ